MRASRLALSLVWAVLVGHASPNSAQNIPTPAGQSLCDTPSARGTAAYNYYCGACYPRCGSGGNTNYDYAAAQRAQADAERKRNASAIDQEGLAAESRGDLEEAANKFMKAEDLDPESPEIKAHLEHVRGELADQGSAEHIRAVRQRIDDSISAAHTRAQRLELEKLARRQARVAAADPVSAACIFDGLPGCTEPIPLVVVNADMLPVPADAARFIESIPKRVRERPEVKSKIDYYARTARIRGTLQDKMIADKAAAKANPGDKSTLRLVGDEGSLKAAVADEHAAKKPLLNFSADTIELGTGPGNGEHSEQR
jgi:tetratricopeptide (TPR) repeat protein